MPTSSFRLLTAAFVVVACTAVESNERSRDPGKGDGPTPTVDAPPTDPKQPEPKPPEPKPQPVAAAKVKAAIASVQLVQDCPDPPEATPAPAAVPDPAPAKPMPPREGDVPHESMAKGASLRGGGGFHQPCTQSTLQLSLQNEGDAAGKVEITAVRLLDAATGTKLAPIVARKPNVWVDGVYTPWNGGVAVGDKLQVSYRLADPDWSVVASKYPAGTVLEGHSFLLEVDVRIDGETETIRSPEFVREPIHVIVT